MRACVIQVNCSSCLGHSKYSDPRAHAHTRTQGLAPKVPETQVNCGSCGAAKRGAGSHHHVCKCTRARTQPVPTHPHCFLGMVSVMLTEMCMCACAYARSHTHSFAHPCTPLRQLVCVHVCLLSPAPRGLLLEVRLQVRRSKQQTPQCGEMPDQNTRHFRTLFHFHSHLLPVLQRTLKSSTQLVWLCCCVLMNTKQNKMPMPLLLLQKQKNCCAYDHDQQG